MDRPHRPRLTARQREVLTRVLLGHDDERIARELHVSRARVATHVRDLLAIVGCGSRAELVATYLGTPPAPRDADPSRGQRGS